MKSNQINIHHTATKLKILHDIAQLCKNLNQALFGIKINFARLCIMVMSFRAKLYSVFIFWFAVFGARAQETASLYYLPGISQASMENPAIQNEAEKLVIGMPFFSGISGQWNSSVPLDALFSKGFSYSFHRLYDALDEKGEVQTSAGAAVFYTSLRHNDYSFNFSVSERAFSDGIFDREIVRIIRDGTHNFLGSNENLGNATLYLTHYRELATGVSKQLWKGFNVGIRPKILFGKFHFSGEDLNLSVETNSNPEQLLLKTEGNFTLAGPLKHVRDSVNKSSTFFADFSPGDYFFQARNLGVALDAGILYKPDKFSEISLSVIDAGLLGFKHKTFDARFSRPLIYSEEDLYQSVDENSEEPKYIEPRQAIIIFVDSLSDVLDVNKTNRRNYSTVPFKISLAGKYIFSEKFTAGVHNQFKNYKLKPLNLFSVYGTATLHPKFAFYGTLTLLNTQNIYLGFGASYTTNWLQIYFTSNNISGIIQPMASKQLNLSFGINFLFDTQ